MFLKYKDISIHVKFNCVKMIMNLELNYGLFVIFITCNP